MSDKEEDINDNIKNLYIIKKKLSDVKIHPSHGYFKYYVGDSFLVKMFPGKQFPIPREYVSQYQRLDVSVYSLVKDKKDPNLLNEIQVHIENDPRFKNYKPIQYADHSWNNNGHRMPILHLCELIKHLYRLANLEIFT